QLIIVCYGPACEEYADRIRHMLFLDGSGFPRRAPTVRLKYFIYYTDMSEIFLLAVGEQLHMAHTHWQAIQKKSC
ncbi:MAG: hypothetical protein J6T10_21350, partial [Methanobrevibacter sp.]|nr:hypothetical protein [Methanobrevibacter sp.]